MPFRKSTFSLRLDDMTKAIDVDDNAGRSVPINMNFIDEGYLSKDTGMELYGAVDSALRHSLFQYKKKDGTKYVLSASGTKLQQLVGGVWTDILRNTSATVTMTIASPAVATQTAHGLVAGNTIQFTTTGALPTGVTAGTTYYIIATGLTANDFQFSTTLGGAAVNTSGTQSGVHSLVKTLIYTAGAEFGFKVYNDELWGCNAVESYFKWNGTLVTEYTTAPKGNNLEIFEDRMFVSGVTAEPLTLYYSDTSAPQTFGGASLVKPLGTDSVSTQKNFQGSLLIFKTETIWKLTFEYNQVAAIFVPVLRIQSGNYGACSRKAVSYVENDLYFFTGQEVRAIGFQANQIGVFGVAPGVISENIKTTLLGVDIASYSKVATFYYNRRFYLAVPIGATTANTLFVCHLLYKSAWTKYTGRDKAKVNDFMQADGVIYTTVSSGNFGAIKWNATLNDITTAVSSEVFFKRLEDDMFNRFRTYRYLDLTFKDLQGVVTAYVRAEANDASSQVSTSFIVGSTAENENNPLGEVVMGAGLVGDAYGQTLLLSPFNKRRISFLSRNQALIIGLSNARADETFSISQYQLSGFEMPKKTFSPNKIISLAT